MAGNRLAGSKIILAVGLGIALFIVAIIARSFWLSLVLGAAGGITLAYAVYLLREYRMGAAKDDEGPP